MSQELRPGDFLVFQLEAGFAMLRLLAFDDDGQRVWHLRAYGDLFPDVESAEESSAVPKSLSVSIPHVALTERAFASTQVARVMNLPLDDDEMAAVQAWRDDDGRNVSDRSIRLLMGLR